MSNRTISPLGLAQVQLHEGFQTEAAELSDGCFVVGYGHVCHSRPVRAMTKPEAAALLCADLAPVEQAVSASVERPLSQGQFDALVSFAFSIGVDAFKRSDVLRRVKAGEFAAAAYAMDAWRKSSVAGEGAVVEALVRRRAAERALLLDGAVGAPSAWLRPELDHAAAILGAPVAFGVLPPLARACEDMVPTPANDAEPLLLTQRIDAAPAPADAFIPVNLRAPKKRTNGLEQAALGVVALMGLGLMAMAGIGYFQTGGDMGTVLLLGAPGVAATLAGLFFLTRRIRPVFA